MEQRQRKYSASKSKELQAWRWPGSEKLGGDGARMVGRSGTWHKTSQPKA